MKDDELRMLTGYINQIDGSARDNKEYTQIGNSLNMVSDVKASAGEDGDLKDLALTTADITLTPLLIQIDEVYSTIVGCLMNTAALEMERNRNINIPFVKFTHNLNFKPFSQSLTTNGIDTIQQVYLKNITDFMFIFPRNPREATVFKNPLLEEFTINTMSRNYPKQPLNFTSSRLAAIMMNARDLIDGSVGREYEHTISIDRACPDGLIKPYRDLTSFFTTLNLERPSAMGVAFDGLDNHEQSVSIRMKTKYKCREKKNNDYVVCDGNLPPPSILCTLNDAYWIFSSLNGGEYIYSDNAFKQTIAGFLIGAY